MGLISYFAFYHNIVYIALDQLCALQIIHSNQHIVKWYEEGCNDFDMWNFTFTQLYCLVSHNHNLDYKPWDLKGGGGEEMDATPASPPIDFLFLQFRNRNLLCEAHTLRSCSFLVGIVICQL